MRRRLIPLGLLGIFLVFPAVLCAGTAINGKAMEASGPSMPHLTSRLVAVRARRTTLALAWGATRSFVGLFLAAFLGLASFARAGNETNNAPRAVLDDLLRILPRSAPFEEWLHQTGALPPDFSKLPGVAALPDPLGADTGAPIRTASAWKARRTQLLASFEYWLWGTFPRKAGALWATNATDSRLEGYTRRTATLVFGPEGRATLGVELWIPAGKGPFPVFLTQETHRRWASAAAERGYLACVYAGADQKDDTEAWRTIWPECDWTRLARRAWAASRCIDYLVTLPEVDAGRIALMGHSRNGKTSIIAAARDERIRAVVSSSSGAGGACSFRFFSEAQFGEGIELLTRQFPEWFHPRLRFFVGREDRLPVDQNMVIACIAPRAVLISTALNDSVESAWAVEKTRESALRVYRLLRVGDGVSLRYRQGDHSMRPQDVEGCLDWVGGALGIAAKVPTSEPIYPDFASWQAVQRGSGKHAPGALPLEQESTNRLAALLRESGALGAYRNEALRRVRWALGEGPEGVGAPVESGAYGAETSPTSELLHRSRVPGNLTRESLNFGAHIAASLVYPTNAAGGDRRLPAMIWVHPTSVSHGYVAGYLRGDQPYLQLAKSGYAILSFDQIGNGSRVEEIQGFYRRFPRWSILGKMVADVRQAIAVLSQHPRVAVDQIYVTGYGVGGTVALHVAALDDRIAGVIIAAPWFPTRDEPDGRDTGGVAKLAQWMPLLPRLAPFAGRERELPYDLGTLLSLAAPKAVLLLEPRVQYLSDFSSVVRATERARCFYTALGVPKGLVLQRTDDYDHFSPDLIFCLCGSENF